MKVEAFHHPMMIEIGGRLSYVNTIITTPDAPKGTVLCLHEFSAGAAMFQPLADQLAALGWKVVAPDMPGRGQSQRLPTALYTWNTYVNVLAAVLRLHNLGPLVILGVGWGAMLALGLENLWRPRPAKLVLCDLPMKWQFSMDPRAQLMAQLCEIVGQNDADFMGQAQKIAEASPNIAADILRDVARRLTGPKGARSLGTDPRIFASLRRDPKTTLSSAPLLRACTSPTELLYTGLMPSQGEIDAMTNPQMTLRQIEDTNFFDCSEQSILLALCDAIKSSPDQSKLIARPIS